MWFSSKRLGDMSLRNRLVKCQNQTKTKTKTFVKIIYYSDEITYKVLLIIMRLNKKSL